MSRFLSALRSVGSPAFAVTATLASFGLILGFLFLFPWKEETAYKLFSAILSAAFAFTLGGFVAALLAPKNRTRHALLLGLFFGAFSFSYLFALSLPALFGAAIAAGLSLVGGMLTERLVESRIRLSRNGAA